MIKKSWWAGIMGGPLTPYFLENQMRDSLWAFSMDPPIRNYQKKSFKNFSFKKVLGH